MSQRGSIERRKQERHGCMENYWHIACGKQKKIDSDSEHNFMLYVCVGAAVQCGLLHLVSETTKIHIGVFCKLHSYSTDLMHLSPSVCVCV